MMTCNDDTVNNLLLSRTVKNSENQSTSAKSILASF